MQRDVRFRTQLSDATSSVTRNVAEGFGRFRPRDNANFVRIAKGLAQEVHSLLIEALSKSYISREDFVRFETAANRAIGTLVSYLTYLDSCDPDGPPRR